MELFEAIAKRHSYRGEFKDEPVKKDDLIKIVEAGMIAPSGKNEQTTDFVIIDQPELVREIAQMHPANKAMKTAQAFIACVINKVPVPVYEGEAFEIEDCAAATENMLLAITALGYASVWIDGWLRVGGRNEKISKMLNVSDDKILRILLPIGFPVKDWHQPTKKIFDQRAWFNSYES